MMASLMSSADRVADPTPVREMDDPVWVQCAGPPGNLLSCTVDFDRIGQRKPAGGGGIALASAEQCLSLSALPS